MSRETRVFFVPSGDFDPDAPTTADLERGVELTDFIVIDDRPRGPFGPATPADDEPLAKPTTDRLTESFAMVIHNGVVGMDVGRRRHGTHPVIDGEVVEPVNRAERRALRRRGACD